MKVLPIAEVHKVYKSNFKKMVVRLVLDEGRTIKSINEEYNLGEGTVRSWIKRFEEECASDPEKQDLKELYEEKMERGSMPHLRSIP